ncbi:MAG: hypothetical protein H6Q03_2920, partial [Acidobacteria bacterium]|nr:hypothetical protein [Acidobacteriota bacterium]
SAEERRWWRISWAYVAAIYLSLYPLQFALDFLRTRNLLRLSLAALALVLAGVAVRVLARRRAGRREWLVLVLVGATYVLAAMRMPIVQERLHLAEYGGLALAFRRALALGAAGLAALAGLVDELIQGVLPNRQYDLRDVGFNAGAAVLALVAAGALAGARASDGRRQEAAR